jgi:hypothetical protein
MEERVVTKMSMAAMMMAATIAGAAAQGRPDSRQMSCAQVQNLIVQNGAVVLTTGQFTYDRYVASRQFCSHPNIPVIDSIQTRAANQCPVYRCGQDLFLFDD